VIWWLLGCGRAVNPEGMVPPEGFACPSGAEWRAEVRSGDVEVHTCAADGTRRGPHVERYVGGGIAVEGQWRDGGRDGVWTAWSPDGAFRSQTTWVDGVEHGPRREVSADGRVVEIQMERGQAVDLRGLPADAPMPEWSAGQRVEGVRYRTRLTPSPSP
jgi:hypothetical protein